MDDAALTLLAQRPAQVARWCGAKLLTDELHGLWMRQMLLGEGDMTLLAHRGSYKTTSLIGAIAISLVIHPDKNILFLRKTDGDVVEVVRQVRQTLLAPPMQLLSQRLWGRPAQLLRADQFSLTTDCYTAHRGAAQLLGQGIRGSLTGKHADLIFTDDIVNLQDRLSPPERAFTRDVYRELQNIRIPGGRIINTGTPWHPADAVSLMPAPQRWDWRRTGLIAPQRAALLRQTMTPALFAANYELRHQPEEDALFPGDIRWTEDAACLRDGIAHLDAAYGGRDFTALTCGRMAEGVVYLYGRLWPGHVDRVVDEALAECERLMCAPLHLETNGDKGYLARELRRRGASVRPYQERSSKHMKITTLLRKWWPRAVFVRGTDETYIRQIQDYGPASAHDDAPDSAASLLRVLDRAPHFD